MLTPLDIQNKEFGKGFRGYKEIEVDSFLDEVITDYEFVFKENLELKGKIDMLNEQIKSFSSMETTLQKTLVVAQNTAEEVIQSAREQEASIIEEAERRANKITESATDNVIDSHKEYEIIRKEIMMFKNKYKSLLTAQLDTIDHYTEDNVFSVLDDMKEKDFEFAKQEEKSIESQPVQESQPEIQQQEQAAAVETQEYEEPEIKAEPEQVYEAQTEEEVKPEPIVGATEYEKAYAQIQKEAKVEQEPEIEFKEQDLSDENMINQSFQPEFKPQFSLKKEAPELQGNVVEQESTETNPFADSYKKQEENHNDSLGFYIESLKDDKDDQIEDLSNHTKRPILD